MTDPIPSQPDPAPVPLPPAPPGEGASSSAGATDPIAGDASTAQASSSSASVKIGEVEGDVHAYTGGEQIFYQYQYQVERQERPRLHFESCDRNWLEKEQKNLFWSASEQQMLITRLESRRFLVLCGEPELGKESVARLLAATLCVRHRLSEMLYCRQSPAREMEIPLQEICGGSPKYKERVVVLKDVLAQDNVDIHRFLLNLDEFQLSSRGEELRRSRCFLIFTTDSERLGGLEPRLQGLGLLQPLSAPQPDVLLEALHRLAEPLLQVDAPKRETLKELLRHDGERITEELKTLPRVARFVRESLPDVLSGRISLEQALRRAYDLESWLLRDLPEDFEAWCYALALVLCHAAPLGESVTWMHFDRFRQLLARHLRQELRRFGDKRAALELCREEDLARLARAEVQRLGYPLSSSVAFSNGSYPERLWKVLLGPGRHLLALLTPFLQALTSAPEFYLRAIAARALGRIGELDPFGITFLRLQESEDGDGDLRSRLLGQMLQGAFESDDVGYKHACLRQLRRKLRSRSPGDVTVALRSLGVLGELDLALALREMRATSDYWLIPRNETGKKPDERRTLKGQVRKLEQLAQRDTQIANMLKAAEDGHLRGMLDEIFSEVGLAVLDALQYALVGLCLGREPISSLVSELQGWAGEEGSESGQFLTLLFLRPHGVLDILDHISMPVPVREGGVPTGGWECGVILYELTSTGNIAIPPFQTFLETLHARLSALPGPLRLGLRKRWLGSLKGWAQQACKAEACRPSVVSLLRGLVRSQKPEVCRDVLSMLQGERDFLTSGSNLEGIAIDAITGISP